MDLTALQHSPFLQSLGWAIANSLWQAAALWIAYLIVNSVYKSASAKFKNNLSTILLSASFVWFCITLFTKYFALENTGRYVIQFVETKNVPATYNWDELLNKLAAVLPYLSAAYLLLLLFLSFRLINVYRYTRFIKSSGLQKPGAEWKLFTEKVARHMGITRQIRLWVSKHVDVPATIGFIKPVILIPLASVNKLSADQLEAIILHELSHIKRNDYLINLVVSIIETILFFNPFVVLLAKIIKRERENCCDDFVIQYQYDRHAYASALLSLEQFRNVNLRLAIGATSGKKQLLLRVKRIMEINSNSNFNYGQKLAALLLITGVISSVAWLSPESKESKKLQAIKTAGALYETKINKNGKPETFFLGTAPVTPKVKTVPVKTLAKKALSKSERELKEFRALNLMAIAEQDYRRTNFLLEQSKKEVVRKKIRVNVNKFLLGNGYSVSFDNAVMAPFRAVLTNEEFNRQRTYYNAADLQKLQAEMEKAQFAFSFEPDKLQEAVKIAFDSKQLLPSVYFPQNVKEVKTEKVNKTQGQSTGGNTVRTNQVNRMITTAGAHGTTVIYMDSLAAMELKEANRVKQQLLSRIEAKTIGQSDVKTSAEGLYYGYAYTNAANENKLKRSFEKDQEKTTPVTEKLMPASAPMAPGTIYYRRVNPENPPAKTFISRTRTTGKDNVRVEYKNGVIYINGKEINLPDTDEMLAQISVKGKKLLSSKVKDITVEIND